MTVESHGVDTLAATLRESADALRRADDLAELGAEVVLDRAKPRTPKRTGALMATVRTDAGKVVAGSRSVAYAGVVHWGSRRRNIVGRPWITDAATVAYPNVVDAVYGGVVEIIERVKGE